MKPSEMVLQLAVYAAHQIFNLIIFSARFWLLTKAEAGSVELLPPPSHRQNSAYKPHKT
jgi:hypothetical protein